MSNLKLQPDAPLAIGGQGAGDQPLQGTDHGLVYGHHRTVTPAQPAAGANLGIVVPGEGAWIIRTVRFQLVTSAAVANRQVQLAVSDGQQEYLRVATGAQQVASLTTVYTFGPGLGTVTGPGTAVATASLPAGLVLYPGFVLSTVVAAIDVADQISGVALRVVECPVTDDASLYWYTPEQVEVIEAGSLRR